MYNVKSNWIFWFLYWCCEVVNFQNIICCMRFWGGSLGWLAQLGGEDVNGFPCYLSNPLIRTTSKSHKNHNISKFKNITTWDWNYLSFEYIIKTNIFCYVKFFKDVMSIIWSSIQDLLKNTIKYCALYYYFTFYKNW